MFLLFLGRGRRRTRLLGVRIISTILVFMGTDDSANATSLPSVLEHHVVGTQIGRGPCSSLETRADANSTGGGDAAENLTVGKLSDAIVAAATVKSAARSVAGGAANDTRTNGTHVSATKLLRRERSVPEPYRWENMVAYAPPELNASTLHVIMHHAAEPNARENDFGNAFVIVFCLVTMCVLGMACWAVSVGFGSRSRSHSSTVTRRQSHGDDMHSTSSKGTGRRNLLKQDSRSSLTAKDTKRSASPSPAPEVTRSYAQIRNERKQDHLPQTSEQDQRRGRSLSRSRLGSAT